MIFSTGAITFVPYPIAAIACAPPILYISFIPQISAATNIAALIFLSEAGGEHTIILFTPATFAGTADIINDEGYTALPPGT